jgi:type I restriction enzyme, S subunit
MRDGWEIKKFEDVCELVGGSQPPKDEFIYEPRKGYIRLIQVRDYKTDKYATYIPKERAKRFCNADDIMIGRYGPPIFGIFKGIEGAYNVALMKAIVNKKICDADYFFKFLQTENIKTFVENSSKRAAGQDGVRKELLAKYPVPLPPLSEQKRIVEILDEAFAAIDKAKANVEKNLQNAKELFESYLQNVFKNKGDDWEQKQLKEVFEIKPPKVEAKNKLKENDSVSFLPMEDLNVLAFEIKPKQEKKLKEVIGSYTYFADNDVLLAKITPCFENGKIGIAKNLINGIGFGSSEYIVFRANGSIIPEYLYYFLSRNSFREDGRKIMAGAVGHKRVTKEFIEEYTIPFPISRSNQQALINIFNRFSNEIKRVESLYKQKLGDLEELKKSILQKAFSGELTAKTLSIVDED